MTVTFIVSIIIARFVITTNIIDTPNYRSSHTQPTPRCGGIAVLCAYFLNYILNLFLNIKDGHQTQWLILHVAMFLFALIGFIDDLYKLSSTKRFLAQIFISLVTVIAGNLNLETIALPKLGIIDLNIYGIIFAVLWLIFYTNVFNFMDGLNGISGGVAIINLLFIGIIAYQFNNLLLCKATLCLITATFGFLVYNFPRGRLFLGDVGSYFLGFTIAGFSLTLVIQNSLSLSPWIFIILYFNYIFDVSWTLIYRISKGQNITIAHREHLYQCLHQLGWSHTHVSLLYWTMSFLQGLMVLYCINKSITMQFYVLLGLVCFYSLYAIKIHKRTLMIKSYDHG